MRYLIFAFDGEGEQPFEGPPRHTSERYLDRFALPALREVSEEFYANGLHRMLETGAKSVYLVDRDSLLWCVEWDPGLIVVRLRPEHPIAAVALRSPVPEFGGRTPDPEDDLDYDEDFNPQYDLIFDAWDSLFDGDTRSGRGFVSAAPKTIEVFESVTAWANDLASRSRDSSGAEAAHARIAEWAGSGVRVSGEALDAIR